MWKFCIFVGVLGIDLLENLIRRLNEKFAVVAGIEEMFCSNYYVLEYRKTNKSNNIDILAVLNLTMSSEMSLVYFQDENPENVTEISTYFSPEFVEVVNCSEAEIKNRYHVTLHSDHTSVRVFKTREQKLHNDLFNVSMIEIIYAADGNLYKSYTIYNSSHKIRDFNWESIANPVLRSYSSLYYGGILSYFISGIFSSCLCYAIWFSRKRLNFLKMPEDPKPE